jgi:hypothetical protein
LDSVRWNTEDWSPWLSEQRAGGHPQHIDHALREILRKIPPRNQRTVVELTRRDLLDVEPLPDGISLVILLDAELDLASACGRQTLERIYSALSEGGLLVATFPAVVADGARIEMPLCDAGRRSPSCALHEVDLQYRLFRTGFQGIRIRRFSADAQQPEMLLCMAIRRANN